MLKRWIPWKFLIRRAAKAYGLIDPINLLVRVRRFAQPSEVQEPIELLRAGVLFHARGLINTKAIQHNLDWIWPYWVERQFNPNDSSFIPRGFSFSHVNLTHRNWTAVGLPNLDVYPLVDPRGLLTPLYDGWSLDFWVISPDNGQLLPSQKTNVSQKCEFQDSVQVITWSDNGEQRLQTRVQLDIDRGNHPFVTVQAQAISEQRGWLVVALRPYNPEGIQFIHKIEYLDAYSAWKVNNKNMVLFNKPPDKVLFSDYSQGDVIHKIGEEDSRHSTSCNVGMATSAAFFSLQHQDRQETIDIAIPLEETKTRIDPSLKQERAAGIWKEHLRDTAVLNIPDKNFSYLYNTSVRTLLLLSSQDIVPGPYTYKRFWFRDACFMINALLSVGSITRARSLLDKFPDRQKMTGYFHSQEGEWDSNGQALWIIYRFHQLSHTIPSKKWKEVITKGARWIRRKRTKLSGDPLRAGLFPPGFSAEHLGPNDYYYWDNFWSLAGLRAAASLMEQIQEGSLQQEFLAIAQDLEQCIEQSIKAATALHKTNGALPASPYRRMDAGAVGSLVADYPLQITPPGDTRIINTVRFLQDQCFYSGGFFQDMIHSGINPYLTLCIAQTMLRNGDPTFQQLMTRVAELASPTGLWPEAIHPITGGGCMGDGQHGWAAAEWVMMIRNLFVREERGQLIIGSGIFPQWIAEAEELSFGPTPTPSGQVKVCIFRKDREVYVDIQGQIRIGTQPVLIEIPGYRREELHEIKHPILLRPIQL